jgi:hypothetical protein
MPSIARLYRGPGFTFSTFLEPQQKLDKPKEVFSP